MDDLRFEDLGLSNDVLKSVREAGYEQPSPIQAQSIPILLSGNDLVGLAQTGTGKTAAFALPILSRISTRSAAPQALVLAPTRELVLQVSEAFGRYAHHRKGLQVLAVYGGQAYGPQLAALRRGAHVVVATPGRLIDHLNRGTIDLGQLKHLVLDEADEMLRMGFLEDVEQILATTPAEKQIALFSATMPAQIKKIAQRYLHDPVEIAVKSKTVTAAHTRQRMLYVQWQQKMDALTRLLEVEQFEAMIIFVRTKSATEDVAERLRSHGFAAAAINGDLNQAQRERVIGDLRAGKLDLLVATDVAARGLDVERISHVLNYDIPTDTESYVHRIGRTGRAGRSGEAILFVTPRERGLLAAIEKATKQPIEEMALPTATEVNAQRVAKLHHAITDALSSPAQPLFRDLVLEYSRDRDVPLADIAGALAAMDRDVDFLLNEQEAPAPKVKPQREKAPRSTQKLTSYRIDAGKRNKVTPAQVVAALVKEGKVARGDIGAITIKTNHTTVELPPHLSKATMQAMNKAKIGGRPAQLRPGD